MRFVTALLALPLLHAQETAVVEGVAFDRLTGAAVPNVAVTLRSPTIKGFFRGRTDANGVFRIAGLEPGEYAASVLAIHGYAGPRDSDASRQPFRAEPGRATRSLRIPMTPLGSLEGRVLDGSRRPVPKVEVELVRKFSNSGHYFETDAEGRFRIPDIEPGAYRLRARPPLHAKIPASARDWVATYYPSGTDIASAQTIVLSAGAHLSGFDIRLQSAPRFRVRGIVLDDAGQPVPAAEIVQWPDFGHGRIENRFRSAIDGTFDIHEIGAGDWKLAVYAKSGEISLRTMFDLSVPKRDMTDVVIRLARPFPLESAVAGLSSDNMPADGVMVSLRPRSGFGVAATVKEATAPARIPAVYPGTYRIGVGGSVPGHYVASIFIGGEDVTGRDVSILGSSQPVSIVFRPGAAQVSGIVEKGAGVQVVLVEADEQREIPMQSMRKTICDEKGNFALDGLRPGTWLALAFQTEKVDDLAVYEAVFRGGLANHARTVRLTERDSVKIELAATPWPY